MSLADLVPVVLASKKLQPRRVYADTPQARWNRRNRARMTEYRRKWREMKNAESVCPT